MVLPPNAVWVPLGLEENTWTEAKLVLSPAWYPLPTPPRLIPCSFHPPTMTSCPRVLSWGGVPVSLSRTLGQGWESLAWPVSSQPQITAALGNCIWPLSPSHSLLLPQGGAVTMASLPIKPVSRLRVQAKGPLSGRGDDIFRWQEHPVPRVRTC